MTMNTYAYNLGYPNPFGLSALISNWGNPHLKWQKTLDQNYGLDLEILNRRLYINFDYFYKTTDPLLIYVEIPTSTGTSQIAQNVGAQKTKGFTGSINYRAIRRDDMLWNINFNVRNMNSTYFDIGNSLDNLNEENKSRNLQRYYDGASTTDLWSVKSLGIDPATGREVFEKKDGTQTFVHDYNDEQVLGNSTPLAEGVVGSMFAYKGFSFSANFRYRYGGQIFLNTLYSKVENISTIGLRTNQDKRALYDRWQKPGDESLFKSISLSEISPISSRFMADENTFACESVSLGYESIDPWTKKLGLSSFQARMYMNEIFRFLPFVTNAVLIILSPERFHSLLVEDFKLLIMIKLIKYSLFYLCPVLMLSSCDKFLEVKPQDNILEDQVFSSVNGFNIAINGIYAEMNNTETYGTNLTAGLVDVMAQYYLLGDREHVYAYYTGYDFNNVNFKDMIESIWSRMYTLIANTNAIIARVDEKQDMLGNPITSYIKVKA